MKQRICQQLVTVGAWLLLAGSVRADVTYRVTVNTASINTSVGYLNLQFNPGNSSSKPATVKLSNFSGGTAGVVLPPLHGNVTGTVPGTVTMINSTPFQERFQRFTHGNTFSFLLTLSGAAIDNPNGAATAGSTFGLALYDSNQNPILTNQGSATGFAGQVQINPNGSTTPTSFNTATGARPVVTFQLTSTP